jgi:DNA-binding transcriptional LysR family regulator
MGAADHLANSNSLHIVLCNNARMRDWDALRTFLAVARTARISEAARQLGIEHTTVSRRLATLEAELGVPLFYRTAAGYKLTPHGERILVSAETMERAALTIGARAREGSGRLAGRVRVALLPEFASHWLAPKLPKFRERYPEIDIQLLADIRQLDLSRGEAELAVRMPRPRQAGLAASRIGRTTTGLYASRNLLAGHELNIEDVDSAADLPLLCYAQPYHALQGAAWFQPVLAVARVTLTTNSTHALLAAALASAGIAVLPRFVAGQYDELVPVSPDLAAHDFWLVTHPEFRRDPKVRATADFLKRAALGPQGLR